MEGRSAHRVVCGARGTADPGWWTGLGGWWRELLVRLSQRGSERRCSAVVSGGAARSRLELSHAPTSTSIHLPASASDRFLVWTLRPGRLPTPLPALNSINNAAGSRLAALDPCQFVSRAAAPRRANPLLFPFLARARALLSALAGTLPVLLSIVAAGQQSDQEFP